MSISKGVDITENIVNGEEGIASSAPFARPTTTDREALLVDGSDDLFRQLVYDLFTIANHMQTVREGIAGQIGVTGPQYSILMAIAEMQEKGGAGVKSVAKHLHVSGAFVTSETGKLIKRGLLLKKRDLDDGRRVLLTLTKNGQAIIEKILPELSRINDVFFSSLDETSFIQLARQIENMVPYAQAATKLLDPAIRKIKL